MNMTSIHKIIRAGLGNPPTFLATQRQVRDLLQRGVPGDFVECGVYAGAHPALMALELQNHPDQQRRVHLFDSFEGIPHAGPNDDETITGCIGPSQDGRLVSSGVSACSIQRVQRNMARWGVSSDLLVYHEGWFQHTVPETAPSIGSIALLRLDGDLYESTRVCLTHLEPKVPSGGIVCIDDYALTGCRRAVDEHLGRTGQRPQIITIEGGGGPVWWYKP